MENFKPKVNFRHLEGNFQPIKVCIHNKGNFENSPFVGNYEYKNYFEDVDYSASPRYYKLNKMLNGGWETYVISDANSNNKFTQGLFDCTGFIVVAEDKNTNQNISILSHQDPKKFLEPKLIDSFKLDLAESLKKISMRAKKGSVDAIIYGGNRFGGNSNNFEKSIKLVSEIIYNELGFKPTVTTAPKEDVGSSDIYFDNKNRRAYLFVPEQKKDITLEEFHPDNVIEQVEKQTKQQPNTYL
ncbi:MAG: hypothetical protein WCI93_00600 [bacterium]